MNTIESIHPSNDANSNLQSVPGGFWRRMVASFIDAVLVSLINMPFNFVCGVVGQNAIAMHGDNSIYAAVVALSMAGLSAVFSFLGIYFYYGWFYSNKGATPGKMALGLRVIYVKDGSNLSYMRTFGREVFGKIVSILPFFLGFIWACFRRDKKTFHDLLFNSQVLRR